MSMRFYKVTLGRDCATREVTVPSLTDVQAGDAAALLAKPGEAILSMVEVTDDGLQHADGLPAGTQTDEVRGQRPGGGTAGR